ncbi:MAG TPA: GNAT family N-acetyltransferase [Reyranella sp.]|nr:GNAT family N-acetyltransferase [Reyranella sp.]
MPLNLRPVESTDGDALHAVFTEPGVRRYLFDDVLLTRAETQAHVEAACEHGAWVILRDGAVAGLVSLRPVGGERELVIVIAQRHWGTGLAFAAAAAAMCHGFKVLGLSRIAAAVDLPNERSHRLMLRLGFVPTGEGDGPKYRHRTYVAVSAAASSTSSTRS